ncbi:IS5 family transposase [Parasphingorhabdus halotolerans]|uniref:IS5 family transposase n=1 Tax=Parasphingorhabdus halotolerans TaxID=2725558 RepID=A0A6H2DN02_9SPHN|nr:IS5 family transposase [Parasphingorhabdus halotolerans]QJB69729.1 IS5 family transposase [Parasphingorhabdus halotolerans]QJB69734.1 IS5 family transposase [Parasphingorhabdus halotolerans]QJB69738.1 IS5 family transposase [Parasphingorhabdus halotolerans]QJB69762.1 IS5 family transposase [Parasphingorhabdus halotolerans]
MSQRGFFDLEHRYEGLDAKSDPLVAILAAVPFELFRVKLKSALVKGGLQRADADRKSLAGRKPWDEVLIFKALVLQALYNLSDDAMEYQLRDRLSFMRFVGLGLEDAVPDAKTLWLYREALGKAGAVEGLFNQFDSYLKAKGYLAMGGQIIDATIVPAPRQRNTRDDNMTVKAGRTPADWEAHPAKNRQKDKDARWTKKHGKSHFGYKNHINIDRRHKLVRRYAVSTASVHDSQKLEDVLDPDNTASGVSADSAYRSKESEEMLAERAMKSHIHRRGNRGKPLTPRQEAANKTRSKVRARVEHVFGNQHNSMGGKFVRTIGIIRAGVKIGMQNLAYNMRRLVVLERAAAVAT